MGEAMRGYERRAERLCEELSRLNYRYLAGLGTDRGADAAYRRQRRLLSLRALRRIRRSARGGAPTRAARARALLEFVVESRVNASRLLPDGRVARIWATALVRGGGHSVPLGSVRAAVSTEPGRERRRALWRARARLVEERLDPELILARRLATEALVAIGYESASAAIADAGDLDLPTLAADGRSFLDATADLLADGVGRLLDEAGAGSPQPHTTDLSWAFGTLWRHQDPGPGDLRGIYAGALGDLGIDPFAGGRVALDLAPRPAKTARAFCAPLRVPSEIRIVLAPAGDWSDLPALMHEAGHAMHRAHTDPTLDVPARLLGDCSVTESWAFLLEGLCADPEWLRARGSAGGIERLAGAQRLRRLLLVRRHCARLLFELELEEAGLDPDPTVMSARYRQLQLEAGGVDCDGAGWLSDLDPWLYSARYLRGWMLAASWRADLRSRFGERWFAQPAAGRWLRGLWAQGQRLGAAKLLADVLGDRLGFEPLARELRPSPVALGAIGRRG